MKKFSARYFDGKTARPEIVEVLIQNDLLHIMLESDDENDITWLLPKCKKDTFSASRYLMVKNEEFPAATLEFRTVDADYMAEILGSDEGFIAKIYSNVLKANPVVLVVGGFASMAFILFAYVFWLSPWVGERAVAVIPKSVEVTLGKKMMSQFLAFDEINEEKSEQLQAFFDACDFPTTYPIEVHYMEGGIVNAFAAPGGQIVVYEGLINKSECWDEVAGVLAHELAHVENRHSFKMLCRSVSSYILLSYITGDVAGITSIILENANQLNELSYSRAYEKEADLTGLGFMKASQFRPEALSDFFEKMMQSMEFHMDDEEEDGQDADSSESILSKIDWERSLEILSTHPMGETRMNYIKETIAGDSSFDYEPVVRPDIEELWHALRTNTPDFIEKVEDIIEHGARIEYEDGEIDIVPREPSEESSEESSEEFEIEEELE